MPNAAPAVIEDEDWDAALAAAVWRPSSSWPHWLEEPLDGPGLPMTAERLRWCMHALGWSQGELSRRLGVRESTPAQWASGKKFIPHRVAVWLEGLVRVILTAPALPDGWELDFY